MPCSSDLTGFIDVTGLTTTNLEEQTYHDLSVSFAPKTTPSTLGYNKIIEPTGQSNTCVYKDREYTLSDLQICSSIHKGFTLPGSANSVPKAELIITFKSSTLSDKTKVRNILLCLPIYIGIKNNPYLHQLIEKPFPSHKYKINIGKMNGSNAIDEKNKVNSLAECITYASDKKDNPDTSTPPVLGYDYDGTKCRLFGITGNTSDEAGYISGDILQTQNIIEDIPSKIPTLDSIFEEGVESISYQRCFDINTSTEYTYIYVFRSGIIITQSVYDQLFLQMGGILLPYKLGNTTIPVNPALVCGTTHKFLYFKVEPKKKVVGISSTKTCPYLKQNYKCIPLNQLSKIAGNTTVQSKGTEKTLTEVVEASCKLPTGAATGEIPTFEIFNNLSPEDIGMIVGISVFCIIIGWGSYKFIKDNA